MTRRSPAIFSRTTRTKASYTFDTEVRVVYDDDALYFGVFAKDDERVASSSTTSRRTLTPKAAMASASSLTRSMTRGTATRLPPILQAPVRRADGKRRTRQKRGLGRIWDVATRTSETGWVRRNPRSVPTLKFEGRDIQTWGVNFERKVRRLNEDSYWSPLPRIYNLDRVSMAGTVEGLTGLRPGMNLRFKPRAATTSTPPGHTNDRRAGRGARREATA